MKKIFKGIKRIGNFLYENKRNAGIVLYFAARFIFPDFVEDNGGSIMYVTDALLGTGLVHNAINGKKSPK